MVDERLIDKIKKGDKDALYEFTSHTKNLFNVLFEESFIFKDGRRYA